MRERPGNEIQAEEILKLAIDRRLLIGQRYDSSFTYDSFIQ